MLITFPKKQRPKLYGYREAAKFLGISHQHFGRLVKQYSIPSQKVSYGRVFFEDDLIFFREHNARKENLKYRNKSTQKQMEKAE